MKVSAALRSLKYKGEIMENTEVKKGLKNIKTVDECLLYLRRALVKYTTVFNLNYTDYDNTTFTQQIKCYKGDDFNYIILFSDFENNKVVNLKVVFAKEEPRQPHPVFPLLKAITNSNDIITFPR